MSRSSAGPRARTLALLLAAASLAPVVYAGDVVHANSTTAANTTTAWSLGVAPTSTDVAVWNNTVTGANASALGANASWQGVKILNPGGLVTIGTTTETFTLTLGTSGIDMSSATQNLLINSNLAVGTTNQTWQVASGRTLQWNSSNISHTLTGSATISLRNSTGSGTATFDLRPGSNGSVAFTAESGFSGFTGNWDIGANTVVKTLRNGINAWGSGTIYLNGGTVGQQLNFNGAWTNAMVLGTGTTSTINDFNTSGTRWLQLNGVISGDGNLTFQDTNANVTTTKDSTYTIAATNTMSGTVTVASGAFLRVGGIGGNNNTGSNNVASAGTAGTLGTASVTVTGGLAFTRTDAWTVANTLSGAGAVFVGSADANLTATGTQVLTLSGSNTGYTGALTVALGTLKLGHTSALGTTAAGTTVSSGAVLDLNGLTIGGEAVSVAGTGISSGGALINSSGTAASLSGAVTLTAAASVGGSGDLTLSGGAGGSFTLTKVGAGALTLSGTNTVSGLTVSAGSVDLSGSGTLAATTAISLTGSLSVSTTANQSISGAITGTGSLSKSGTGTLTLSSLSNAYSGGTTISAGTLALGDSGVLADAGAVTVSGGTLSILTFNETIGSLTLSSGSVTGATGALTSASTVSVTNATGTTTISAILAGSSGLSKTGAGDLVLSGASTFSGGVSLSAGAIRLGANAGLGSGTLAMSGGTALSSDGTTARSASNALSLSGDVTLGNATSNGSLSIGGNVDLGGATRTLSVASATTLGGVISNGGLTKSGNGTLTLSGANTYAGGTTVSAGTLSVTGSVGAVSVASGATLGGTGSVGAVTVDSGTATILAGAGSGGTLSLASLTFLGTGNLGIASLAGYTGSSVAFAISGDLILGGAVTINVASGVVADGTYHLISHANTLADISSLSITGLSLNSRVSAGLVNNVGYIDYVVSADSPVWTGFNNGSISGSSNWKLIKAGTSTDYEAADNLLFDDTATGTTSVDVSASIAPTSVTFANSTKDYTLSGTGSISGTFAKTGSGNVTLSNTNAFTSSTITGGTVTLGASAALGTAASIALNGGTLDINGQSVANAVVLGGGSLAGNGSISGVISGSGSLAKSTAGTLTLSGANTFTGGTTVSNGVLALGNATDTLADTGAVTVSGGELSLGSNSDTVGAVTLSSGSITGTGVLTVSSLAVNNVSALTLDTRIGGSGATLTKTGAGNLTLNGQNTYTGLTTVSNGTLTLGHATNTLADTGAVTINGGTLDIGSNSDTVGTLTFTSGAITGTGTLTTSGATFDIASGTTTVSTVLGGTTLTKAGAGTLLLTGANTYATGTTVRAGTLRLSGSGTLGSAGTVTLNDALTGASDTSVLLDASSADVSVARAITVANQGTGTATLGAYSNRTGGFATFSGAITLAKDVTLTGGTVAGDRTQFTGGISGTGNVTIAGTTRVMFVTTANTYAGGTTVSANSILQLGDGSTSALSLLPDAGVVTVAAGGDLRLAKNGNSETIGGLAGAGNVTAIAGSDTLVISNAANQSFSGALRNSGGTLNLTKEGAGTQSLSGGLNLTGALDVKVGSLQLGANSTIGSLTTTGAVTTGELSFGINNLVVSGAGGAFYTGKLTGTGAIQLRGGSASIVNSDGTAGTTGNYQIWTAATAVIQATSSQFFALDTGTSVTDRKDFGFINDTSNALNLSSLSGYGAIRNDAGSTAVRQIVVDQSGGDTVFNGALLSHKTATATRQMTLTKRGTSSLTLAGFIGKQTGSQAGTSFVNLTVEAGTLNVTNAANSTTSNSDALSLGTINITGGTLSFSSQALRNTAGTAGATAINLNGGTLAWNAGNTQDISAGGKLTLVAGKEGRLDVGSNNVTLATAFAGGAISGSLTKLGNGALAIAAANTYTGGTTLSAGTLQAGNDSAFGTGTLALNGGALSSNGGTARTLANAVTVGGDVTLGNATNNGALTLSGGVNLGGATRTLTVASATTLSGIISNGGLTKAGNGTLTLSGANTYAGGTTVGAGTLALGASERLLDAGAVTVNTNGTLDLGGFSETVGTLTLAGGTVTNGTLAASALAIQSGSLGAVLSGSATLTKTTSGVATLSGAQTSFTGATSVDAGTLVISGSLSGTTASVASGATLSVTGSLSGGAVNVADGGVLSVSGSLAGATANIASGATLRGTGSTGAVNLSTGGQLQAGIGGTGSLAIGSLAVADANVGGLYITDVANYTSAAAFDITSLSLGTGSSLAITLSGNYSAGTYKLLGYAGSQLSSSNVALTASGLTSRFSGSLDFTTSGQVLYVLEGSKVYWVGDASQWSAANNWQVLVGSSWTPTSFLALDEVVFDDQGGSAVIDVDADVTPTSVAFTGSTAAYTLQGAKGIQGGAFLKSGAGSVTLNNTNAFTSSTITGGTVTLGATDALGTSAVALNGGTLDINGQSVANAIALGGGSLVGDGSLSGVISGSGALAKSTAGTLTLGGQNTYTGGTTVSNGVLVLGHATDTLADTGAVTVSGGELSLGSNSDTVGAVTLSSGSITGTGTLTAASLSTSVAGTASISANIAGSFAVTKTGAGTLTLSGANTYTGGTTVSNGVLSFANGSLGTSGNIAVNGGTLRWASGNTQDISSRLTYAAAGSVNLDTNGNSVTLASVVGGAATSSLTKSGNGTLVLTATANYTGATNVAAGTLQIGDGGATGDIGSVNANSVVTVSTGATLRFFRTGTLDYKTTARMRTVAGAGDIIVDGGAKFFNYTSITNSGLGIGTGFAEANSWSNFAGRLIIVGGSEFQTIRNGRTAMGSAQVVLGDATTSGILSQIEGSWTWTNSIRLDGSANIIRSNTTGSDRSLKLQGVLSGSGNVTLADAGGGMANLDRGFILTGTNTLSGQVTVDSILRVGGVGGDSTDLGAGATGDLGSASVIVNSGANKALVFTRTNALTFAGTIGGAGQVRIGSTTLAATSTQAITLSGANTYTGGTELLNGSLTVNALSGIGSHTTGNEGYLAVKNGSTFTYAGASDTTARNLYLDVGAATLNVTDAAATLRWTDTVQVKGGASGGLITKGGAGTLVLDGAITAGGSTAVKVTGGTLRLNGTNTYAGATTVNAGATLDIAGSGTLLSTTALSIDGTLSVSTSANQVFATALSGASTGSLLKTGNGVLSLNADNSGYAGSVTISGGRLEIGHVSGLGAGVVSVLTGGTLDFANLAAGNAIALGGGTLLNYGSWTGGLVVNYAGATGADIEAILTTYGRSSVSVQAGGTLSLTGMTKDVVFQGGTLSNVGAYTGTVTVRGALDLSAGLPASSGTVRIESGSVNFGGNSFGGTVQYVGGAITNYAGRVNVVGSSPLLTAANLNGANLVLGTGTSASIGAGLTANIRLEGGSIAGDDLNYLTGAVTVTNGITLDLRGSAGNYAISNLNAAIVLESGATLKGTASVGSITAKAGSILAPGNSPGQFLVGSMALEGGAGYNFDIQNLVDPNTGMPGVAGFDYDTIAVTGQLDLSALTLSSKFVINLLSLDMFGASGAPVGWDPATEFELKMFTYGSLKLGTGDTLSSLFLINSDGFFDANYVAVAKGHFSIVDDRANHEIRLAYSAIPEPSTYGLMLGGLALAAAAYRRRRMKA